MEDKTKYLECACNSFDHTVRLSMIDSGDDIDCYMEFHLQANCGFWRRIWKAIKYIFGGAPSRYGHYDEFMISTEQAESIIEFLSEYVDEKEELEQPKGLDQERFNTFPNYGDDQ